MNNNSLHFARNSSAASKQSYHQSRGSLNQSLGSHHERASAGSNSLQVPRPPHQQSRDSAQVAFLRDDTYMQYINQRRNMESRQSNSNSSAANQTRLTHNNQPAGNIDHLIREDNNNLNQSASSHSIGIINQSNA